MLDFRLVTFLMLCEEASFTRTAKRLHISQPAVSQHIHYLEEYYGVKLFTYDHRSLQLTLQGRKLQEFARLSKADWAKAEAGIRNSKEAPHISFGATLTIGEFVMPEILCAMMDGLSGSNLTMLVDNTQTLLQKLRNGEIDFAIVEGLFNKNEYITRVFSKSRFIAVCAKGHPFDSRRVSFSEIFTQRLIVREPGSGTRSILEQALSVHNQNISSFPEKIEIANLNAIKELVAKGLGITFLYEKAAEKELSEGTLVRIDLEEFEIVRNFHFVCLKGSHFENDYLSFLDKCMSVLSKETGVEYMPFP